MENAVFDLVVMDAHTINIWYRQIDPECPQKASPSYVKLGLFVLPNQILLKSMVTQSAKSIHGRKEIFCATILWEYKLRIAATTSPFGMHIFFHAI